MRCYQWGGGLCRYGGWWRRYLRCRTYEYLELKNNNVFGEQLTQNVRNKNLILFYYQDISDAEM